MTTHKITFRINLWEPKSQVNTYQKVVYNQEIPKQDERFILDKNTSALISNVSWLIEPHQWTHDGSWHENLNAIIFLGNPVGEVRIDREWMEAHGWRCP